MRCEVPASLKKSKARAEARKGYQIRKAEQLGILPKCQELLACGNVEARYLKVYRATGGIAVTWHGSVVYSYNYGKVTICHLDYAWVDALSVALAHERMERTQTRMNTAELKSDIATLDRRFG